MSSTVTLHLRPPLPTTSEGLRKRLLELTEAKRAIEQEIREIMGTQYFVDEMPKELHTCLRCGHQWQPRVMLLKPRSCPGCKSLYWDRQPTRRMVPVVPSEYIASGRPRRMAVELPVSSVPTPFVPEKVALTPPPIAPSLLPTDRSLRDRLYEQQEQPERQVRSAPEQEPEPAEEENAHVDDTSTDDSDAPSAA